MNKPKIGLVLLVVLLLSLTASTVCAQELDKATRKECKKMSAQLTKEGWKVFGRSQSIEEAMTAHYKALAKGGAEVVSIEGRGTARNVNLAMRKCQNNAALQYASMKESQVEGTTNTTISNKSGEEATTNTEFQARYKSSTDQVVKSLKPGVVIYRDVDNGMVEVCSFYVVRAL